MLSLGSSALGFYIGLLQVITMMYSVFSGIAIAGEYGWNRQLQVEGERRENLRRNVRILFASA